MRYAQIRNIDVSNGEGVGTSLFVQGCHLHCKNCFNQETWDFTGGNEWTDETRKHFLELLKRPYISRISILGGEPLAQENLQDVFSLVNKSRILFPEKRIWLYTGYVWESIFPHVTHNCMAQEEITRQLIVKQCDVIVDGRYVDELRDLTLAWRGSSNQRVIDVQKSLEQGEVVLWN